MDLVIIYIVPHTKYKIPGHTSTSYSVSVGPFFPHSPLCHTSAKECVKARWTCSRSLGSTGQCNARLNPRLHGPSLVPSRQILASWCVVIRAKGSEWRLAHSKSPQVTWEAQSQFQYCFRVVPILRTLVYIISTPIPTWASTSWSPWTYSSSSTRGYTEAISVDSRS